MALKKVTFLFLLLLFNGRPTSAQIDPFYTELGYIEKTEASIVLFENGKYKEAIEKINEAIRAGKRPAWAYGVRGLMLLTLGQPNGLKDLHKAIKISPGYLLPVDILTNYYTHKRDYKRALRIATKAIMADPTQLRAYLIRATIKLKQSYSDINSDGGAQEDFDYALLISPDSATGYFEIGILYHRLREYRLAVEYYDKCINLSPEFGKAYYNAAIAYSSLSEGRHGDKACAYFEQAMDRGIDVNKSLVSSKCRGLRKRLANPTQTISKEQQK